MLPRRMLKVASLILFAAACSHPQPPASAPRSGAPDLHQAHSELVLCEHRVSRDRDRSIEPLQQIAQGSKCQNPRAAREQVDGTGDGLAVIRELERARKLLERFIEKAGDDPAYADSVLKAQARLDDLRDTLEFVKRGLEPESSVLR